MEQLWEAWQAHSGRRTLVFCCSIRHARFVRDWLGEAEHGVRVEAIDSGPDAPDRASVLAAFRAGELDAICSVDVLNEGVDVPATYAHRRTPRSSVWGLRLALANQGRRWADHHQHWGAAGAGATTCVDGTAGGSAAAMAGIGGQLPQHQRRLRSWRSGSPNPGEQLLRELPATDHARYKLGGLPYERTAACRVSSLGPSLDGGTQMLDQAGIFTRSE